MELPPQDALRFLVTEYARFRAAHGEDIGTPDLVEPTGDYFPDHFTLTPDGVATTLRRIIGYAPVSDALPLELAFVDPQGSEGGCGTGGCGTGACGTGEEAAATGGPLGEALGNGGGGYRVILSAGDVGHPALMTASLARSVGGIVLGEAGEENEGAARGVRSEIAAAASGFGLLLLGGSCVYAKSCGGLRATRATHLDVGSLAVLVSLFCRVHDVSPGRARRHLEATQAEAWDEALRWTDSNGALVSALSLHPESLADGVFAIQETKGFFGRLFGGKPAHALEPSAPRSKRARTPEEERRLAEAKAMVDEALRAR